MLNTWKVLESTKECSFKNWDSKSCHPGGTTLGLKEIIFSPI